MGLFDCYVPAAARECPIDHHPLVDWQGKDGPSLLLWREGIAAPSDELVDEEWRMSEAKRQAMRLPPTFTIYSFDCPAHPLEATYATVNGVWSTMEIHQPSE